MGVIENWAKSPTSKTEPTALWPSPLKHANKWWNYVYSTSYDDCSMDQAYGGTMIPLNICRGDMITGQSTMLWVRENELCALCAHSLVIPGRVRECRSTIIKLLSCILI
jgi:hypothetical protein